MSGINSFPANYHPLLGYCAEHQQAKPCIACTAVEQGAPPGSVILKSLDTGLDLWAGGFGDAYTDRNQVDWQKRIPFWSDIVGKTGARSYFEMGCNAGWNLSALRTLDPYITVAGNDVNTRACEQAWAAGLANVYNVLDFKPLFPKKAELVFTAGVLIHVEDEYLDEVMQSLVEKSYRYVLAIEYADNKVRPIEYRGHLDKCWARPYGAHYEALGLKCVEVGDPGEGFDRCTYWLMEK